MPEVLARTDFDLVVRRDTSARPRPRPKKARGSRWLSALLRPSPRTIIGGVFMGLSAAVLVNALVLQPTRHPAPLFAAPPSAPVALPREAPAAPPERPRDVAVPVQAPASVPAPASNATKIVKDTAKDPLGDFIRASNAPDQDIRILQVQRALAKAGSPGIKADGIMGAGTRQAIEKFERDHKWPVTGEISPRLLRELGITGTVARP